MDGAHSRTLQRALEIVVSKERLAATLNVPLHDLEAYLAGRKALPHQAFLTALDIVAHRPPQN
jgi:DNA-binding transcriptional regulator YiaG